MSSTRGSVTFSFQVCGRVLESEGQAPKLVEYAKPGKQYGILFIPSLCCEYTHFENVRIRVIYRVNQAEYGIHILVVASREYVNIYSTCKGAKPGRRVGQLGRR